MNTSLFIYAQIRYAYTLKVFWHDDQDQTRRYWLVWSLSIWYTKVLDFFISAFHHNLLSLHRQRHRKHTHIYQLTLYQLPLGTQDHWPSYQCIPSRFPFLALTTTPTPTDMTARVFSSHFSFVYRMVVEMLSGKYQGLWHGWHIHLRIIQVVQHYICDIIWPHFLMDPQVCMAIMFLKLYADTHLD